MTSGPSGNGAAPVVRPLWKLRSPPDAATVHTLERSLSLPPALCRLLAARGHRTPGDAKSFLRPLLDLLHDPAELRGAEAAARRLATAINDGEAVLVHGDYDADGIAGAALLTSWIRSLGGRAEAFVPDRLRDGYDLSQAGVDRAVALGVSVLVTVDCGIMAHRWVRRATEAGMDVIVTDHHRPGPSLPPALAVVNPNQPGCSYPNKDLCGAGVAFKVGQLLSRTLGRPANESWACLDLVALATIADQVELVGENRVLARYGLRAADERSRPGLAALMEAADGARGGQPLDSSAVAYKLAPRINAAGRVGKADTALRLLLTPDPAEARRLARVLESDNRQRRDLDRRTTEEAMAAVAADYDPARDRGIVIAGDGWHAGVIGIVASRVVERVFRPVVVIALDGEVGRGSARSIPSFDLHGALSTCAEHLERFGGHHQAAGMDIRRDRLSAFRDAFRAVARERLGSEEPLPVLEADLEISLADIPGDFHRYLRYLGPFGRGNPDPVFVARGVRFDRRPEVTKGSHLRFRMVQNGSALAGIGFGLADRVCVDSLLVGPVDVAFNLSDNTYRGYTSIQATALDIRNAE